MSHYSVIVITPEGKTLAEMLAPYEKQKPGDGGKWDWWVVGGRWNHLYGPNSQNVQFLAHEAGENDEVTSAIITPDGKWHARGTMGAAGTWTDEEDPGDWAFEFADLLVTATFDHPQATATVVDLHI